MGLHLIDYIFHSSFIIYLDRYVERKLFGVGNKSKWPLDIFCISWPCEGSSVMLFIMVFQVHEYV